MFRKNNSVKKMNGGGCCYRLNQIIKVFLIMLFFAINVFAEIPHSYVTENPDKEVTQTETLKRYKEKAELNLSITKINSEEVEGLHNPEQKKIYFSLNNVDYEIQPGDKIYLSEELQEVPSISTTNGRRKINGMLNQKILKEGALEYKVTTNERATSEIEVKYSKTPKQIYIGILDKQYQIKKILKGNIKKIDINTFIYSEGLGTLYNRDFDAEHKAGDDDVNLVNLKEIIFESDRKYGKHTFIRKVSGVNRIKTGHKQDRPSWFSVRVYGYNKQGVKIYDSNRVGRYDVGRYADSTWYEFPWNVTLPEHCRVVIQVWGHLGNPYHDNSSWDNTMDAAQVLNVKLDDFIHKAEGKTNLTIDENYEPEYIKFDSCTIETIKPLSLLNSPKGVRLTSTSGDGLLHLDPTDTLEINGHKHTLTSGNLVEQKLYLNKVELSYKVENGKLQLRVDKYGLKVPSPQPINIKITKNKEIPDMMTHTINLTVPYVETIIGESLLEVKEHYPSPEYIAFNSCDINSPQDIALENALRDVKLTQTSGKGLVTLEHNDILEINGKQYTIGFDGNLPEKHDTLGNINFKFKVENGKFRLALKDWGVLEPDRLLTIKAKRATEILDHKMTLRVPRKIEGTSTLTFKEYYPAPSYVEFNGCTLANPQSLALENSLRDVYLESSNRHGILLAEQGDKIEVNGKQYVIGDRGNLTEQTGTIGTINFKFKVENGKFRLALKDWGILEPKRDLVVRIIRGTNEVSKHTIGITSPRKIEGLSTLTFKEYYPTPSYVEFTGCTLANPQSLALENSLRDVYLESSNRHGILLAEQGDKIEVNGKQHVIGAGGNLAEQTGTIGTINFKFKVENGKFRLALKDWGILEPKRDLVVRIIRGTNEVSKHIIGITSPRRVEGTSTLTFTEKYPIRDIVRFQGITLIAPNIGGIEPPIPAGVSYKSNDGYGIPFMKEGDILEVQCETMRGIQKYIIDSKNSLKHQTIDLPGTVLSLLVEDGKLRLGLNNWLVNKNTVLNFRVIRGVNEISKTSITLEVPKAPFDILKNGILDFGKLIQGSKNKKAETSILLEMHQDISNVRYSLSTTTPELVNSSGATLHARDLQAGVQKQGNKRHLVRIIGRLDVPEKQELGVYRGSVLLNVTIK